MVLLSTPLKPLGSKSVSSHTAGAIKVQRHCGTLQPGFSSHSWSLSKFNKIVVVLGGQDSTGINLRSRLTYIYMSVNIYIYIGSTWKSKILTTAGYRALYSWPGALEWIQVVFFGEVFESYHQSSHCYGCFWTTRAMFFFAVWDRPVRCTSHWVFF